MKIKEKNQARKLRKEKGWPINKIASHLNVSKSTVSLWVRDVKITEEQEFELRKLNPAFSEGAKANKEKFVSLRRSYQDSGRALCEKHKNNKDFISGCMLYWAEGTKSKNALTFTNSDMRMMKFFVDKFLRVFFDIEEDKIKLSCRMYTDIHNQREIEGYWLNELSLGREKNLNKSTVNYYSKGNVKTGKKKRSLEWGTAQVRINSVEILQQVYGAINYIIDDGEKYNWTE